MASRSNRSSIWVFDIATDRPDIMKGLDGPKTEQRLIARRHQDMSFAFRQVAVSGLLVAGTVLGLTARAAGQAAPTGTLACYASFKTDVLAPTGAWDPVRSLSIPTVPDAPPNPYPQMAYTTGLAHGSSVYANSPGVICNGHFYSTTSQWKLLLGGLGDHPVIAPERDAVNVSLDSETWTFRVNQDHFTQAVAANSATAFTGMSHVYDLGYPAAILVRNFPGEANSTVAIAAKAMMAAEPTVAVSPFNDGRGLVVCIGETPHKLPCL